MSKHFKVFAYIPWILSLALVAQAEQVPVLKDVVVVVDKKTNQLHLANYNDGHLDIAKTYHVTLGQKVGDKLMEGDLKTPEGIYEFLYVAKAPQLRPIFGPLAIYIGYPNVMDKTGKKTGNDILLHGTDDPSRLQRDFDSKGCIVSDNANVKEVASYVKMQDTKILVTKDFAALQSAPRLEKAKAFFNRWLKAWSEKDLSTYIEAYADEFTQDHMNRLQFSKYKESLNKKYDTIQVTAENVHYYFHEKYDLISFTQHYNSTFKGGQTAFSGASKKNLYLQERNGEYRILMEEPVKR